MITEIILYEIIALAIGIFVMGIIYLVADRRRSKRWKSLNLFNYDGLDPSFKYYVVDKNNQERIEELKSRGYEFVEEEIIFKNNVEKNGQLLLKIPMRLHELSQENKQLKTDINELESGIYHNQLDPKGNYVLVTYQTRNILMGTKS